MKTFIASLLTFTLIFFLIFLNSNYIISFSNKLLNEASSLSTDSSAEENRKIIEHIDNEMKQSTFLLSLSIGHTDTEKLSSLIREVMCRTDSTASDMNLAVENLKSALEDLKKSESFSIDGLL